MELDDDGRLEWNLKTCNWIQRPSGNLVALCSAIIYVSVEGGDDTSLDRMFKWLMRRSDTRKKYGIG